MKIYADYKFYTDVYGGEMKEAAFNKAALVASQYIRSVTINKSDGFDGEELKYATCEIADIRGSLDVTAGDKDAVYGQSGKEIRSVSNAGFSVTYTAEGTDGETTEELFGRKAYAALRKWLLPTGLLNPGIKRYCEVCCKDGYVIR